ncbi:GtrA family protein [Ruminiclostridium sufflavum]|nr:GtrA family protein [Ruminiclostridium sufflavum]
MQPLLKYLRYSILAAIVDTFIVWMMHGIPGVNILAANTIGVICGFLLHYLLVSKSVFNLEYGASGLIIYFATFLFGLCLADLLIYVGEYYLFSTMKENIKFLFSKGLSIGAPFFALYYLRRLLFGIAKKNSEEDL